MSISPSPISRAAVRRLEDTPGEANVTASLIASATLQPRVRRETDAEQAALAVARQIGLRARFQGEQTLPANPRLIWRTGVGAREDFDRLYVAALRSVSIAAKLNAMNQCEMFCNGKWQRAPRPSVDTQN